jgi:LysR family transcriptional regulator, hydrogen peroxide-inducible genes activator
MNLQQLEYIIAVDKYSNFVKASEACFVTQATLSMMVKKLEEELGVKLFDRSRKPIKTTEIGEKIIIQSRKIILESAKLKELVNDEKGQIAGELKIGIIPTLAPYLLPLFLKKFTQNFPKVNLIIHEYSTDIIVRKLKLGELDTGLLSTPLNDVLIKEQILFYEQFFLYVNAQEKGFDKQYVLPKDIDINRLWLLEEGFCMRSQVLNLCDLKKQNLVNERINYEAGSIETLKNLVENNYGITIIPELATRNLNSSQKKRLRHFKSPSPVREISIVTHREYIKFRLIEALNQTILSVIPEEFQRNQKKQIIKF